VWYYISGEFVTQASHGGYEVTASKVGGGVVDVLKTAKEAVTSSLGAVDGSRSVNLGEKVVRETIEAVRGEL